MKVFMTYDVSIRQGEVKPALLEEGFFDRWRVNNTLYYLPDTTLWHPNLESLQRAIDIFNTVIQQLNIGQPPANIIVIDRLMSVNFETSLGIPGKPHA